MKSKKTDIDLLNEKERGIVPIIVTLIIVLLLGLGIYAYGNIEQNKKDEAVAPFTPPVETATTTATSTLAATSTASTTPSVPVVLTTTYTNSDLGFSLKYASDMKISVVDQEPKTHGTTLILPNDNFPTKRGSVTKKSGEAVLDFSVFAKADPELEAYVAKDVSSSQSLNAKYGADGVKITYEKISVNGMVAYKIRYDYPASENTASLTRVWIQNSSHVFMFMYGDNQANEASAVLGSFKAI